MLKKIIAIATACGALGALSIVYFTTPASIHPIGLLVFFVCIYAVVLGAVTLLLYLLHQLHRRLFGRKAYGVTATRLYEYATIIALGPVILLALQTVGRLQIIDVIFTTIFVLLGCFYVYRRGL